MEPISVDRIEFSAMYTEKLKRHAHADRDRCDRFEVARNAPSRIRLLEYRTSIISNRKIRK